VIVWRPSAAAITSACRSVRPSTRFRPELDILELHDALDRLANLDEHKGRIVELKFFGGLTATEIGEVLNVSSATVEREWSFARAWLYEALTHE
jgi:RNA polymerase sigma factor (sigma-70 family)